jgi:dephospho-CoA kinase
MIIGLSGYAQTGKDTVADILVLQHGFKRVAFADKIRECLYTLNPIVNLVGNEPIYLRHLVDTSGWDKAKQNYEVRRLLQTLGADVGRELIDPNLWVEMTMSKLNAYTDNIVITDVRFPNEYEAVKWTYGEVWRIERPGYEPVNGHYSETALDNWKFDRIIENLGGIPDLVNTIRGEME